MTVPVLPSKNLLDVRAVLDAGPRLFAPWLAAVLVVTLAGYPGVVCVTPLAWLLALRVGLRCASRSASPSTRQRLLEAALAGVLFGLLQGLLFIVVAPRMGEIAPAEQASATVISAGMIVLGMLAGAGLAAFNAWLFEQRRRATQDKA